MNPPEIHGEAASWPDQKGSLAMSCPQHSSSPTIMLRISDGSIQTHRAFNEFSRAVRSAEAYAGAGFRVAMISATGRFLMGFEPRPRGDRPGIQGR
jgi:hypothetical protein